jgi:biopolymer transport protein ExbB
MHAALFAALQTTPQDQVLDLQKVFASSPLIYSLLLLLSVASFAIFLYSLASFRAKDAISRPFIDKLRIFLLKKEYASAEELCRTRPAVLSSIVAAGLMTRSLGPQVMVDAMKSEGKRVSTAFWQRLSLLNDIVIIAPMLGLLGTVLGMFYAFYDVNRSVESINALFDGLGVAVGTTVAGLIVAILSMIFHTLLKYRFVRLFSQTENEALSLSALIEAKPAWN